MFSRKIVTDPEKIEEILTRGVEDVFVLESLRKKLLSGKELRIKLGFDPTGSKIHIGRAIVLRKLRKFQELGHKIFFIIGDFTAQIGDPSDKLEKRPMLSRSQIQENLKNYKKQVGIILDTSKAEFVYNSKWLSKLRLDEIMKLTESFTVQQMLNRRNFKDRLEKNQDISLREILYPLMQGYDSVVLKADIEIGGFDQLFNLKAGRIIQKHHGQEEQDVLTTEMLEGTDGRKMSTSWGNVINITDEPNDMYGKIMSVRDELLAKYFLLCTDVPEKEIKKLSETLDPKSLKMRLAREIVTIYHGEAAAASAEKQFVETFSLKKVPENLPAINVKTGAKLADILVENKILSSKTEFKRLVTEGAVSNVDTGEKIQDIHTQISAPVRLKIGKRTFIEIRPLA